jgi:hypothetical protein
VQVQVFGAAFNEPLCLVALRGCGGVEHAGFDAPGAKASPMRLCEAEDERIFDAALGLERVAEAAENFVVFTAVLFGEDNEGGGGEAVLETVQAAALFAFARFGSAEASVAAIGFTLAF